MVQVKEQTGVQVRALFLPLPMTCPFTLSPAELTSRIGAMLGDNSPTGTYFGWGDNSRQIRAQHPHPDLKDRTLPSDRSDQKVSG